MRFFGVGVAVLVSLVLLLFVWLVGHAAGYRISLLDSIGLTLLLGMALNVTLALVERRRQHRGRPW